MNLIWCIIKPIGPACYMTKRVYTTYNMFEKKAPQNMYKFVNVISI